MTFIMDTTNDRNSSVTHPAAARTSQLCKPLSAILKDSGTLSMLDYFVQFLESKDALHLLQFWFAVESFKNAVSSPRDCLSPTPPSKGFANDGSGLVHVSTSTTSHKRCDVVSTQASDNTCDHMSTVDEIRSRVVKEERRTNCKSSGNAAPVSDVELLSSPRRRSVDSARDKVSLQFVKGNDDSEYNEGRILTHGCNSTSLYGKKHDKSANGIPQVDHGLLKQLSSNTPSIDALSIYTTYVALNALHRVNIPDELRQQIEVNICPEDGKVDRACFNKAQAFVYAALEQRYYPEFLTSHHLCNYQFEYISSGKLTLLDFLLGDNALFYFMEYMEQENCTSLIQFWLTAESFTNELSSAHHVPDIERDTMDAIAIYERYFSLQATTPLHFGDTIRMDIENRICDEHGPRVDSFVTAQDHAYHTMDEFHFSGFLKSSVYLRFLNELVVTINKPATVSNTPAATTAASGGATSNTAELSTDGCTNGLENLDDPDSLWQRPPTVLRLGYVDQFGQYISEIEQAPNTKNLRQKGDTSKKFLWLRNTRNEEEIAMKIARTIITDVLNSVCTEQRTPFTV